MMLPSDSEGDLSIPKLPSDSEGDLSIPTLSQHDVTTGSLQLPSDESADSLFDVGLSSDASDGDEDCDTKKQRRRFTIKPGCSRESMMEDGPQISLKSWMQHEPVPRWLNGTVQDDFAEIFSPPRIMQEVWKLDLRGSISADTDTDWNFDVLDNRVRLVQVLRARRPKVLHVCSPCKMHSKIMASNWYRMDPVKRERLFMQCQLYLEFAMMLCHMQEMEGRCYSHEHPESAISWNNKSVKEIAALVGAMKAHFDMCVFGMVTKVSQSPVRKATVMLTNCRPIYQTFQNKKCQKKHRHVALQGVEGGQKRTEFAQIYPKPFCAAYAQAVLQHCQGQ